MHFIKYKKTAILLLLLWLATVILMAIDYKNYPPDHLHHRGNMEGSVLLYAYISFLELLAGMLFIQYFYSLSIYLRISLSVVVLSGCLLAFINTMHGGGVLALHAIWLTAEALTLFISLAVSKK